MKYHDCLICSECCLDNHGNDYCMRYQKTLVPDNKGNISCGKREIKLQKERERSVKMGKTEKKALPKDFFLKGKVYDMDFLRKEGLVKEALPVNEYLDKPVWITGVKVTPDASEEYGTRTTLFCIDQESHEEIEVFCFSMFIEKTAMVLENKRLFPFACSFDKSGRSLVIR